MTLRKAAKPVIALNVKKICICTTTYCKDPNLKSSYLKSCSYSKMWSKNMKHKINEIIFQDDYDFFAVNHFTVTARIETLFSTTLFRFDTPDWKLYLIQKPCIKIANSASASENSHSPHFLLIIFPF